MNLILREAVVVVVVMVSERAKGIGHVGVKGWVKNDNQEEAARARKDVFSLGFFKLFFFTDPDHTDKSRDGLGSFTAERMRRALGATIRRSRGLKPMAPGSLSREKNQ